MPLLASEAKQCNKAINSKTTDLGKTLPEKCRKAPDHPKIFPGTTPPQLSERHAVQVLPRKFRSVQSWHTTSPSPTKNFQADQSQPTKTTQLTKQVCVCNCCTIPLTIQASRLAQHKLHCHVLVQSSTSWLSHGHHMRCLAVRPVPLPVYTIQSHMRERVCPLVNKMHFLRGTTSSHCCRAAGSSSRPAAQSGTDERLPFNIAWPSRCGFSRIPAHQKQH